VKGQELPTEKGKGYDPVSRGAKNVKTIGPGNTGGCGGAIGSTGARPPWGGAPGGMRGQIK